MNVKKHKTLVGMVREISDDADFAAEFEKQSAGRKLVRLLAALRAKADLSQGELAAKLNCTQSKVSKLESGEDSELRFGMLLAYTAALGYEMRIMFAPKGRKLVDEVKGHAHSIQQILNQMVDMAGDDTQITAGVARFLEESAFNLTRLVQDAAGNLPQIQSKCRQPLYLEAPDVADEPPRPSSAKHRKVRRGAREEVASG